MLLVHTITLLALLAPQEQESPPTQEVVPPAPIEEVQETPDQEKAEVAIPRIIPVRPKRLPGMGLIRIHPKPADAGPPEPEPTAKQDGPRSPFGAKKIAPFADLVRGTLPENTSPSAQALWSSLVAASKDQATADATALEPISSFDLKFQIEIRDVEGRNNEAESRVRYLAPNYIRFQLEQGIELGCGPVDGDDFGYWSLNNGKDFQDISLRQYALSKQRVQDVLNTSINFLALVEPANLRILALSSISEAPQNHPPRFGHLNTLDWITLDSPDFDLGAGSSLAQDPSGRVYRAYLGLGRTTHRVTEALVVELADGAPLVETAIWITLGDHRGLGGVMFPGSILIRRPDFAPSPWAFTKRPTDEFYLIGGTLRAKLDPEDFRGR